LSPVQPTLTDVPETEAVTPVGAASTPTLAEARPIPVEVKYPSAPATTARPMTIAASTGSRPAATFRASELKMVTGDR
jgi:hypothetical protein